MESTPVNWEALDSLVIDFARSENLLEDSSSSSPPRFPSSSSPSPSSSSSSSSSSYQSRLLIRQIRRSIESGDIDSALDSIKRHVPAVLDDHRILFRLQKQKFIELLRRGTERDRELAIVCVRGALAPCALDAYPEAYEEFKHVLLALIFHEKDQTSPVASEWSEKQRFDLAGLLCSILRAFLHAYEPLFSMTLRYLISIHKVYCLRQGISSPISDLTERLLFDDRDPPATPHESLYEAPPFDEVDIQALAHAVELTRQGAVDSLRFAKGDLFQAFQNELCRRKLDVSMLDHLVHEYCIYRGIVDSSTKPPSAMNLVNSSSRDCSANLDCGHCRLSDGETSVNNVESECAQEANADSASMQVTDVEMRFASEVTSSHEDCSTSDANHPRSCSRRLRRSRYHSDGGRRKRWRGRIDLMELKHDAPSVEAPKQGSMSLSAPGKVLITGGYLILERPNAGLILSTTARFYAIVKPIYEEIKPESWAWSWTDVRVTSPQLLREATYKLSLKNSTLQCTSSRESTNPFVEQAVQYSVAAAKVILSDKERKDMLQKLLLQGLDITILGCNDFYSYRNQIEARGLPLTPEALAAIPPFSSITFNVEDSNGVAGRCKPEVAKTGLGSSAAMTTSVVAALHHYLGAVNLPLSTKNLPEELSVDSDLDLVHIIAQSAHCIAQGKIGSGFDVSAAVYGSQRYVRFSPAVLSSAQLSGGIHFPDVISDILKEKWDHEKLKFSLPPLMTLLLGEPGTGGSSTPSMVGSVKQWQKTDPQKSLETWRRLADANSKLEAQFQILNKFAREQWEAYKQIINICSGDVHGKWREEVADQYHESVVKPLLRARDAFLEIRFHMQQMGNAAGIPIEPESQTQLLDATMSMAGVLLAGVPGAGGFDAVFAIILEGASDAVSKAWSSQGVLPLLVREDPRGVALESSDPRANELTSAISSIKVN